MFWQLLDYFNDLDKCYDCNHEFWMSDAGWIYWEAEKSGIDIIPSVNILCKLQLQ